MTGPSELASRFSVHPTMIHQWKRAVLEGEFCVDALHEAIHKFDQPEIMNTDQGSQFMSLAWTDRLRGFGVRISMDGKGRFLDNILVERLWRSLKYECVYLQAWETGSEAKAGVPKNLLPLRGTPIPIVSRSATSRSSYHVHCPPQSVRISRRQSSVIASGKKTKL